MSESPQKFSYSFFVWPSEAGGFTQSTYDLFRMMNATRWEMEFTEAEFWQFRHEVEDLDNLTLREVSRIPYHEPETVL